MKRNYQTPVSVPVQITAENFLMTSNLQDYPDNPIFGAPIGVSLLDFESSL